MRNRPFSQLESTQDAPAANEDPRRRPWLLGLGIVLVFAAIGVRIVYVQVVIADRYIAPWSEVRIEEEPVASRDGRILSRDGVVLAQDESRYDVTVDYRWIENPPDPRWMRKQVAQQLTPQQRKDPERKAAAEQVVLQRRQELVSQLAAVTGLQPDELAERMNRIQQRLETMRQAVERKRVEREAARTHTQVDWSSGLSGVWKLVVEELTTSPDRYANDPVVLREELQDHLLLRDVPLEMAATIQSQPARFPGVHIRSTSTRVYPREDFAAHLIGVRKPDSAASSAATPAVRRQGESGIERTQSSVLAGVPGRIRHQLDRHGERVRSEVAQAPRDGKDVVLTIDARMQEVAEQLLDGIVMPSWNEEDDGTRPALGGTLVAMDIWTGDVVALACSPRPSLNVLVHPSLEQWKQLQEDIRHPLFPRITQTALAPGGLFQVISAAAALESGVTTAEETFDCKGYLDRPDRYRCLLHRQQGIGHGAIRLDDAICRSCQVYFYDRARRLGAEPIRDWAQRLGFGSRTGIDLPGEVAGTLPGPAAKQEKSTPGSTLQLAVGQGEILVTPLQVTRAMAAIANGGYFVQPRVTLSIGTASPGPAGELKKIDGLSAATVLTLQRSLERVVHDPQGVGREARIDMMTLAGIPGVAEMSGVPGHVWFAGYAPAQQPRVAFAVVLEHAGEEVSAAPMIRDFVTELLGYGYLRPYFPDALQTEYRAANPDGQ